MAGESFTRETLGFQARRSLPGPARRSACCALWVHYLCCEGLSLAPTNNGSDIMCKT